MIHHLMKLLLLSTSYLFCGILLRALVHSPLARYFADSPDHRKVHQAVVPRIGGVGMILAFLAVVFSQYLMPAPLWPQLDGTLLGAVFMISLFLLVAGTLDDVRPLDFKLKFLFQFVMAAGVVVLLDRDFDTIAILGYRFDLGPAGQILSILWMVAIMNALNMIDGIDGLAGGVALCSIVAVAFMAHANGADGIVMLCVALTGVVLGFLRFNFSGPHKLFLGDAGSQFLGAMLALLSMEVQGMPRTHFSIFVPLFIVGYPLLDVSVAMIRRFKCGPRRGLTGRFLKMFAADNEHLHHRLVYLGHSHVQSAFLLMLVAGGIGATAIIISRVSWPVRPLVMAYLGFSLLLILNRLGYIGIRPWLTFPRFKSPPGRIVGVIEPDEVFFHSLKSFKQTKFEFLNLPGKLTQFMSGDFVAVLLYNAVGQRFEEEWRLILRATETQDCPAVVIADAKDIHKVNSLSPGGYPSIHFMEKPLRIPELIQVLEGISNSPLNLKARRTREASFSLAELALRNRKNG